MLSPFEKVRLIDYAIAAYKSGRGLNRATNLTAIRVATEPLSDSEVEKYQEYVARGSSIKHPTTGLARGN